MGLAIVARIVALYGGRAALLPNADGPGMTSEIFLPLPDAASDSMAG